MDDCLVVVRHIHERSLPITLESLRSQALHITLVNEYPFIEAVKKSLYIGARSRAKYLLIVDGDIILFHDSVGLIREVMEREMGKIENLYKVTFSVWDKVRGMSKVGCHAIVNRYSSAIYDLFKEIPYDPRDTRPETHAYDLVNPPEFESVRCLDKIVGVHEFEQYYRHIYIKHFNRIVKSKQENRDSLMARLSQWELMHPEDPDFRIALEGCKDGLRGSSVITDANRYPAIDELLERFQLREKLPIGIPELPKLVRHYSYDYKAMLER